MTVPADIAVSEVIDQFQEENQELAFVCDDGMVGLERRRMPSRRSLVILKTHSTSICLEHRVAEWLFQQYQYVTDS
jgi:hypothetical protein